MLNWTALQRQIPVHVPRFNAIGALVAIGAVVAIFAWWFFTASRNDRSDELINAVLLKPTSPYMSAINTLGNGSEMIAQVQLSPPMSNAQLSDVIDRLRLGGMNSLNQIDDYLRRNSGGGRLQSVNNTLKRATATLNDSFADLADCYRNKACGKGLQFDKMCKQVKSIQSTVSALNNQASRLPGVMLNASGADPLFGHGSMDAYFELLASPNINYLAGGICR
jgi:hypothetical protein